MPAKVGPKRVRALARAGCYFDSSAATCGAGCVLDRGESGESVRPMKVVTLRPILVIASQRVGAKRRPMTGSTKLSIVRQVETWMLRFARNDG